MTEETHRCIKKPFKVVGMVGAIIGGMLALWQYHDSTRKQFEAPIWIKQVELYTEATETIARLAYTESNDEWNKARLRFWELYAGSLILVEDNDVAKEMVEFGEKVEVIGDDLKNRNGNFKNEAISLSYVFRKSLKKNVGSGLPALQQRKN